MRLQDQNPRLCTWLLLLWMGAGLSGCRRDIPCHVIDSVRPGPAVLVFGDIPVSETATDRLSFINDGCNDVTVLEPRVVDDSGFEWTLIDPAGESFPVSLSQYNGTLEIDVTFVPAEVRDYEAQIELEHAWLGWVYSASLQGSGVP